MVKHSILCTKENDIMLIKRYEFERNNYDIKISPIFRFAKSSQIQTHFPIMPIAQISCEQVLAGFMLI
jgi:hypothetical protein